MNTESTSLIDVPETTNDDKPPTSVTDHFLYHISSHSPLQQTLIKIYRLLSTKHWWDAYETDKDILATYTDTVTFLKDRDDEDEEEEPSTGSNRGPREEDLEKNLIHLVHQRRRLLSQLTSLKKGLNLINTLARNEDPHESFNELIDTPLDFSAFVLNWLKVDTLTPELLVGPTYELMKDWNNPEGQQYPHDLRKPLPLILNSRGCRVIPFDHFINNDLAYLSGGVLSRTYATSVTKTKATDYGHIKWIEYLVPNTMWSQVPIVYGKHALWSISHWGRKRQQFYGFAVNREYACDVYSKHRIFAVTKLKIIEWHNYKHLDRITVCRDDDKLYTFKEGDYKRLRLQDIEDMLLLLVQGMLKTLTIKEQKKNRLMRIDELYKFSDATLNDVRERAGAMIQAINQQLRNRRIMRSLENFVGGRPYVGDLWLLERTI
ncbi:hypothetical protein Tco_0843591 [Tanacetum coccineum]|uniref:Uncharacterized protein n=1 Tax=Tanacetum coccineum TaxID=301880 RepID=A0ABQ5B8B1_9ASTR